MIINNDNDTSIPPPLTESLKRCCVPAHVGANPLPTSEFSQDSRRTDGLRGSCKKCDSVWSKAHWEKRHQRELITRPNVVQPPQVYRGHQVCACGRKEVMRDGRDELRSGKTYFIGRSGGSHVQRRVCWRCELILACADDDPSVLLALANMIIGARDELSSIARVKDDSD